MKVKSPDKTDEPIRWAIGTPSGPRSSAWRLWGNRKGDLYVAVRALGGTIKASFHKDRRCQVGFTAEYETQAVARFGVKSRHWETWKIPDEVVVQALMLGVPESELRVFADPIDGVQWLAPPDKGLMGTIVLMIAKNGITISYGASKTVSLVGKVSTSIRTGWLFYNRHEIDSQTSELIASERNKLRALPGSADLPAGARAVVWDSRADHNRHALEFACDFGNTQRTQ